MSKSGSKHGPLRTPMAGFGYTGKTPSIQGDGNIVKNVTPGKMAPINSPLNAPAKKGK